MSMLLPGCKEKKLPEHVVQQQEKIEREAKQRKRFEKEAQKPREEDLWPAEVREAYYRLFLSSDLQVTAQAQVLAQLGLQAVPSMKFFLSKSSMKNKHKRALVSFMLVDLHMFRPAALAELAREWRRPIVQRAAIEALVRINNPTTIKLMAEIKKEISSGTLQQREPEGAGDDLDRSHGQGGGEQMKLGPLAAFVDQVRSPEKWGFSDDQLALLDRLMQARIPAEVTAALQMISDRSLEPGLLQLLRSPVVLTATQQAVAKKVVEQNGKRVRQLCGSENPMVLRAQAARTLIAGGNKLDLAFLRKLSKEAKDPFAPVLQEFLSEKK